MNSFRFSVFGFWFVICAIMLTTTSNAAEITITPLNDTPQTNTTYTLNITVNNNETIHGLELTIQETPDNAIYAGYNTTTRLTGAIVSVASTNTTTTIAIIFDALSAGLTPGNETIIQLHYNATTTGQTNYTITELHAYNSTGNETTQHTTTNTSVMIISPPTPYVSSIRATNATGNISEQKTIAICLNNENEITQLNMTINWDSRIHYINYTPQNDAINATITNTTNQTTMQLTITGNLTPHNCNETNSTNSTIIELNYKLLTLGQIPVNIVNITTHNETLNSTSAIIDAHAQNKIKIPTQTATTASTVIPLLCIQNDQPIKKIIATLKYNAAILSWTAPTTLAGGTLTTTDTTGGKIITLENPTFNQHDACTPIIALPFTTTGTIGTNSPLDLENVTITNTSNDNMTFTTENGRIDISNNHLACAATTAKQGTTTPVFISLTNNDTTTTQHMKLNIGNLTYNTSSAIIGTINTTTDTNITIDQTFTPLNPSTRATTTLTLNVPQGTPSGQYNIEFIEATINNNTAGPQHACTVTVITDYCYDNDADGYGTGVGCLIQDCNDNNPAIHPGKTEACNGQDDNCNGISDEGVCSSGGGGGGGGSGSSSSASAAASASSSAASSASGGSNSLSTLENLVNRKTTPTTVKAPPKQEKPTPTPETPALDAPPEPKETTLDSELLEWAFLVFLGVLVIGGTSVYQSLHRTEKKEKIQITPPTIPITQRITNKLDKYKKIPVTLPEPPKRTGITPAYFPTQKTTQPTQTKQKIEVLPPKEQLDKLTQPEKLTREEYAAKLKQKHK